MAERIDSGYVELGTKGRRKVERDIDAVHRRMTGMKSAALSVGGALGLAFGGRAVVQGIGAIIAATNTQVKAEAVLARVLETTGHAAGYTLAQIKRLASERQDLTLFGDEETLGAASKLATFVNIQGQAFETTLGLAQDMSTVMEQDLKSSVIQLGKALNDPIKGMTALMRVGVSFSQQQKDQIKGFIEAGDLASAQGVIFAELKMEFGGAAEAAREADMGFQAAKNSWNDFLEEVGKGQTVFGDGAGWMDEVASGLAEIARLQNELATQKQGGIVGGRTVDQMGRDGDPNALLGERIRVQAEIDALNRDKEKLSLHGRPSESRFVEPMAALETKLAKINGLLGDRAKLQQNAADAAAKAAEKEAARLEAEEAAFQESQDARLDVAQKFRDDLVAMGDDHVAKAEAQNARERDAFEKMLEDKFALDGKHNDRILAARTQAEEAFEAVQEERLRRAGEAQAKQEQDEFDRAVEEFDRENPDEMDELRAIGDDLDALNEQQAEAQAELEELGKMQFQSERFGIADLANRLQAAAFDTRDELDRQRNDILARIEKVNEQIRDKQADALVFSRD